MPASLDLVSYYGWMAAGILIAVWFVLLIRVLGTPRRYGGFVAMTVVTGLVLAALVHHDRWGAGARARAAYERTCSEWRNRYDKAMTVVELERARDGLREALCRINPEAPAT